jgi:hypothetical protein
MKTIYRVFLIATVLALTACGGGGGGSSTTSATPTPTPTPTGPTAAQNATAATSGAVVGAM